MDRLVTDEAIEREIYMCSAEEGVRCDHRIGWWAHACDYDDGHDGAHECICGHTWTEGEQ